MDAIRSLSRINLASGQVRAALVATFSTLIIGTLVLPTLLTPRYRLWGISGARDALKHFYLDEARREREKKIELERWMDSERAFSWQRLLKSVVSHICTETGKVFKGLRHLIVEILARPTSIQAAW